MAGQSWNPFARSNPNPAAPQQQQQQPTPSASQQQQNGQPANSNFQSPTGAPTGGQGNPAPATSPMDEFNSMFGVGGRQEPMAQPPQQMMQQPAGSATPQGPSYDGYTVPWDDAQMRTKFSSVKFSQGIPQELKSRIQSGDHEAMFEALDHVGREAFLNATRASHGLIDRGVKTGLDKFGGSLDDRMRDYNIRNQNTDNEVFNHPTVAPTFQAMKSFIAQNNPNMSAQDVVAQTQKWFTQMSSALQAKQGAQQSTQNQPKETNWESSFMGEMGPDGGNFQAPGF